MMGPRRSSAILFLLAFLVSLPVTPAESFRQRVRARILQSQPFRVDFVQQVYVDEELTLKESGVIVFADREHVKWQYIDPEYKVFILEQGRYRFYDRENNQLLQGQLGERNEQLIAKFEAWLRSMGCSGACGSPRDIPPQSSGTYLVQIDPEERWVSLSRPAPGSTRPAVIARFSPVSPPARRTAARVSG